MSFSAPADGGCDTAGLAKPSDSRGVFLNFKTTATRVGGLASLKKCSPARLTSGALPLENTGSRLRGPSSISLSLVLSIRVESPAKNMAPRLCESPKLVATKWPFCGLNSSARSLHSSHCKPVALHYHKSSRLSHCPVLMLSLPLSACCVRFSQAHNCSDNNDKESNYIICSSVRVHKYDEQIRLHLPLSRVPQSLLPNRLKAANFVWPKLSRTLKPASWNRAQEATRAPVNKRANLEGSGQ